MCVCIFHMKVHVHSARCMFWECVLRCTVRVSTIVFIVSSLCSLYFGKPLATLPRLNPQPSREHETGGRREQKGCMKWEREHELKASVEGTTQCTPSCRSTTRSCEAEPHLTLTSKSFCLNTHHSPQEGAASFFSWGQAQLNMRLLIASERWIPINSVTFELNPNPCNYEKLQAWLERSNVSVCEYLCYFTWKTSCTSRLNFLFGLSL